MKNKLLLQLIMTLISISLFAQKDKIYSNYIIQYELNYIANLKSRLQKSEKILLLIGSGFSLCESFNKRYNDSVEQYYKRSSLNEKEAYGSIMSNRKRTGIKYKILKKNDSVFYTERFILDDYIYGEKLNFDWKISEEKKKIGIYNCQKAISTFGGRNFIAWFTKDIPISEGPYKFKGLPGLIVNIKDDRDHYIFNMLSIKRSKLEMNFNLKNAIEISKKKYYQNLEDYRENFVQHMIQNGVQFRSEEQKKIWKERGRNFKTNELELKAN